MSTRSTILDVANRAGVGKVTVSYVLNGRAEAERISQATIERVLRAAVELNYRPNAHARNLATRKSNAIGVVFQYGEFFSHHSNFITEVLRAVCMACVEADVDVTLHTRPSSDPMEEANFLSDGRVDAVILIRDIDDPVHKLLLDRNFPAVLFFCRSDDPRAAFVSCDNYNGGRQAVNHLVGLGHRRIVMLRGPEGSVDSNDRYHGYLSALDSAEIPHDPSLVLADNDFTGLRQLIESDNPPTAAFTWSDDSAMDAILFLSELGMSVPTDLSVVGFDGTAAGGRFQPSLTSVRQPIAEIATAAVQLAIQLAATAQEMDRHITLAPQLITRESTAFLKNSKEFYDKEVNSQ
ncbi:MAG: LacI family DNA-binding transcriptional regulator [Fimbriimonadaceae bacterium]